MMAPIGGVRPIHPELPWCVLTGRLALGGGGGTATFHWDTFGGMESFDYEEKNVSMSVGQLAIIPEAFFMPTRARHFIISASLPFGGGGGKMGRSRELTNGDFPAQPGGVEIGARVGNRTLSPGDRIFDGEKIGYRFWFLNLGLGYQWFFGAQQRTNLFLMSHFGPGRTQWTIDYHGDTRTSNTLSAWDFDISVGSWHRWSNNFVLGGSLDLWWMGYQGKAGDSDIVDTYMRGGLFTPRLSLIAGYAFK